MASKLNHTALKNYSADFTGKILADAYASKTTVKGQELLTLTPCRQVNLAIISRLFDQWKADAQAFRSPYFDFENPEVVQAMEEFMNTASRHISIKRSDLQPLLQEATEESVLLLLAPDEYFDRKLRAMPNFIFDKESAGQLLKYTHIHAGIPKALSLRLADGGSEFVYVNQVLHWLADLLQENTILDEPSPYIDQFSSIVALSPPALIERSRTADAPAPLAPLPPQEKKSFFDTALTDPVPSSPVPTPSVPIVQVVQGPRPEPAQAMPATNGVNSLNNRYKVDFPESAAETNYGNVPMKVDSIMKSIALGQRFMFVNQLFNKNSDAFDEAIHELDRAATFEEARELMAYKFASKYFWDMSSDAVNDLMSIVKRKFN
jgi:hypothetical protein